MASAEMRAVLGRAAARRHVLEGLIASAPPAYGERRAEGDAWSVLDHLRHVATVDGLVVDVAKAAARSREAVWLGGAREASALEARRAALMEALRGRDMGELLAAMRAARAEAEGALLALPAAALEREVRVAGLVTPWGEPQAFTLRAYLAAWAEHDGEHEAAIRRAMETPPDATTLSLAARRVRDGRR